MFLVGCWLVMLLASTQFSPIDSGAFYALVHTPVSLAGATIEISEGLRLMAPKTGLGLHDIKMGSGRPYQHPAPTRSVSWS